MALHVSSVLCVTSLMFVAHPVALKGERSATPAGADVYLMADALVTTIDPRQAGQLERIAREIERRMARSPGTPLADKLEDALAKVNAAGEKLRQARPDRQGALGELEGAVGDLDAAASAAGQPRGAGVDLMDRIAGVARELAENAIRDALASRRNSSKIAEARAAFARGDARRRARGFKDALAAYKDASSKAEGA